MPRRSPERPAPTATAPAGVAAGVEERIERLDREHRRLFAELLAGERRFRGLARSVWRVQEDERRRLSRELHDGLGQVLTALGLSLERLAAGVGDLPAATLASLTDARELAAQALRDTRELSRLLRPQMLDDLGLGPALGWLARTVGERAGLEIATELEGLEPRLAPELETLAFRVVQEALTNVVRHAAARTARVEVAARRTGSRPRLVVRVRDDGRGFDPGLRAADGGGLAGIRDRVELFGGTTRVDAAPGRGTTLEVEVALENGGEG